LLVAGIMLLIAILGALALLARFGPRVAVVSPPKTLTIAVGRLPHNALVYVAQSRGYFREEGLDLTIHSYAFGKEALDALLAGKADMAAPGETPIMLAVLRDEPITVIAGISSSDRDQGIVARRGAGISSPSDLAGKRIATSPGTTGDYFRYAFLAVNGIPIRLVQSVDMRPEEMPEALASGRVDAVSVWNPYRLICEKTLGKAGITFGGEGIYTQTTNIAVLKPWVAGHRESIEAFLRALMKSESFITQHPAEALQRVVPYTGLDRATLEELWGNFRFHLSLPQVLLINLENQVRWAEETGMTTRKPMLNFLDFIYLDGLLAVAPARVTIVH
jgi:NitT/TauT family transport system substrate-binding protein